MSRRRMTPRERVADHLLVALREKGYELDMHPSLIVGVSGGERSRDQARWGVWVDACHSDHPGVKIQVNVYSWSTMTVCAPGLELSHDSSHLTHQFEAHARAAPHKEEPDPSL